MRQRDFRQVDVFTRAAYRGNPVAVVMDAAGMTTESMQRFANWTNLSETTFLLPPGDARADYRVRIFTPVQELPFAGHPTLGTCHAWLEAGGCAKADAIVQECGIGLVEIAREGDLLSFAAPALRRAGPLDEATLDQIAAGLGIARGDILAHAWCDNGPPWQAVLLRSGRQVLEVSPDPSILTDVDFLGLVGAHQGGAAGFEVRAFFPAGARLREDPVTGSLNAALGQWLIGAGLAPRSYTSSQGGALGRDGLVQVRMDEDDRLWVGGASVTCVSGSVMV